MINPPASASTPAPGGVITDKSCPGQVVVITPPGAGVSPSCQPVLSPLLLTAEEQRTSLSRLTGQGRGPGELLHHCRVGQRPRAVIAPLQGPTAGAQGRGPGQLPHLCRVGQLSNLCRVGQGPRAVITPPQGRAVITSLQGRAGAQGSYHTSAG